MSHLASWKSVAGIVCPYAPFLLVPYSITRSNPPQKFPQYIVQRCVLASRTNASMFNSTCMQLRYAHATSQQSRIKVRKTPFDVKHLALPKRSDLEIPDNVFSQPSKRSVGSHADMS